MRLTHDIWLSETMNIPAYRLENPYLGASLCEFRDWLSNRKTQRIFVYVKLMPDLLEQVNQLEAAGFHLVDTNLQLSKKIKPSAISHAISCNFSVRFATSDDLDSLVELGRRSFSYSRFHRDPLFPVRLADKIKAEWVHSYFVGRRGEYMIVAENEKGPCGFIQLLQPDKKRMIIDLIATDESCRGLGVGSAMIRFVEQQFPDMTVLNVGTQLANQSALNFYQSNSFLVTGANYVFHFHQIPE